MRLSAGIETLAALDKPIREELFASHWPLMWGMRNRIAHGYLHVDKAIVQETLKQDLPIIVARIETGIVAPLTH